MPRQYLLDRAEPHPRARHRHEHAYDANPVSRFWIDELRRRIGVTRPDADATYLALAVFTNVRADVLACLLKQGRPERPPDPGRAAQTRRGLTGQGSRSAVEIAMATTGIAASTTNAPRGPWWSATSPSTGMNRPPALTAKPSVTPAAVPGRVGR